jgi:hypothetical protein
VTLALSNLSSASSNARYCNALPVSAVPISSSGRARAPVTGSEAQDRKAELMPDH